MVQYYYKMNYKSSTILGFFRGRRLLFGYGKARKSARAKRLGILLSNLHGLLGGVWHRNSCGLGEAAGQCPSHHGGQAQGDHGQRHPDGIQQLHQHAGGGSHPSHHAAEANDRVAGVGREQLGSVNVDEDEAAGGAKLPDQGKEELSGPSEWKRSE